MIIVDQKKNGIVNFDTISVIVIDEVSKDKFKLIAHFNGGEGTIGTYKTEERAKEVLKDIIEWYDISNFLKGKKEKYSDLDVIAQHAIKKSGIYYMPEE